MRGTRVWLFVGVPLVVVLAGLLAWNLADSGGDDVAIPEKVCQKSLPSEDVEALLPRQGKLDEDAFGFALPAEPNMRSGGGTCEMQVGEGEGRAIGVRYDTFPDGYSTEKIREEATKPGMSSLALGDADGYVGRPDGHSKLPTTAFLFLECRKEGEQGGKNVLRVSVAGPGNRTDKSTREHVISLVSDAMRTIARDQLGCAAAGGLPEGPAVAG